MTVRKERLTVTVDRDLVAAGSQAVANGEAESLSAWVNAALAAKAGRDRREAAARAAVADFEAEFGEITEAEVEAQRRVDRENAIAVRGRRPR